MRVIMINFMAAVAISMCALGIGLCIYLLIHPRVDTKPPTSNMLICFFGLGWMRFLMQALDHVSLGCFFGITFFFIRSCDLVLQAYKI